MRNELNVWVIGGDMRQVSLAELLEGDGHTVHTWGLEGAEECPGKEADFRKAVLADCVILPLPAMGEDGRLNAPLAENAPLIEQVLDALRPGQVVCGGRVSPQLQAMALERDLRLWDYYAREELAVSNAVPTALAVGHWGKKSRGAHIDKRRPHGKGGGG